jgi:hypothetical protein
VPDPVLLLVIMAVLGALLILGMGLLAFRAFGDQGSSFAPMPTAYRGHGEEWRRGTLRFSDDRLALRGPGGLVAGPWIRGNLDLGMAAPVADDDSRLIGRAGLITVPVRYGTSTFELALDEQHYTALRSWVEAVPPGWNTQVA